MCVADIASVYTTKMPSSGQSQCTESAVSHGGQYLRGMSVPGDGRMIRGEEYHGIPQQHYGYSYGGEDCCCVPQSYSVGAQDRRGVPQHYSHAAEDHRSVPQQCGHSLVYDRESPVL